MYKPGKYSNAIAAEKHYKTKLEIQNSKNVARNEKEYGGKLHMLGRKALFELIFESKKFNEQDLPQMGQFEDITQTYHFIEGLQRGLFLYESGIIPQEYQAKQQNLIENGMMDITYENAISYLIELGAISEEYFNNTKKHR